MGTRNNRMVYKNFNKLEERGFTLIEIVIIVGIIGILSSIIITGGNKGLDQRKIILESRRLSEDIRKVQNLALSSTSHDCGALGNKVAYFGIILDTDENDRYSLVVDCNENKIYDSGDILLSTMRLLSTRITILVPTSPLSIFFIPPLPQTSVNTDISTTAEIRICGINETTICRHLYINPRGSVTVQAH